MFNYEIEAEEYDEKLKFFLENINDLVFVVIPSKNFSIDYINKQEHNSVLGYKKENIIHQSILDFIHSDDKKEAKKILKRIFEGKKKLEEIRLRDINEKFVWFEFVIKKFKDNNNDKRLLIIAKDLTEKKKIESKFKEEIDKLRGLTSAIPEIRFWKLFNPKKYEEAFKLSNEMLQNIIDNIPVSIFWKDVNLTYLGCNDKYAKLIGITIPENIIGENDESLLSNNESLKHLRKKETLVMKSDVPEYHVAESRILRDGSKIWLDINRIPLHDSESNIVGLLVTYEDITERKKAEEQLKNSETKFRQVFEAIPDIYFLVSYDGTILDYRGESKELYFAPKDFLKKKFIDLLPTEVVTRTVNSIRYTIETGNPSIVEYSLQFNDEMRFYEARILYFSKESVAIFIREISERKRVELLIKEEFKKLKELEQIRKDLISRFSHELKTPLIPLITGAELLTTKYKEFIKNDEAKEIVELINRGSLRLNELINKLLEVTRIEAEKLALNKQKIDLSELIRECTKDMKFLMEKRKLSLNLKIPEKFNLVIDEVKIDEVIRNLLSNAIKNTPPNGNVKITLKEDKNWAFFTIKDTGVGFTKEEMALLFTRFGKIERYGKDLEYIDIQGSGLGLFITKKIIEMHNGQIRVESLGRNKGSRFIVKLPIS